MERSRRPNEPAIADNGPRRVIVVEDYKDVLDSMVQLLTPIAEIIPCSNATEALHYFLDAYRCKDHCGMILDAALPDINGIRTMAAIRELERGSTKECVPIRFAVVSGNAELVQGTPSFDKLGVSLVLPKPVQPETFVPRIRAWLNEPAPELYRLPVLATQHTD